MGPSARNGGGSLRRRDILRGGRDALLAGGLWLAASPLLSSSSAWAGPVTDARIERARRRAIRRGLEYLAEQQRTDHGFGADKAVVAMTSLCVLCFLADGSTDTRGPYHDQVRRGVDFLVDLVEQPRSEAWHEGYFYYPTDTSSRMHGQGYATLALASALGTTVGARHRRIRAVLKKAVACIEQSQTETGGFGYNPVPHGDHEGSVTVTVAQGLRAARDAGLLVDQRIVDRGLHYLRRSQKTDGSFRYSVHTDRSSYALTAAALSSFFLYGKYQDDPHDTTMQRGLEFMMGSVRTVLQQQQWYYYGNFYAAWTCWQKDGNEAGRRTGGYWARWHRIVYEDLLDRQRLSDGAWVDDYDQFGFDDVLPTAFAVLTLTVPDEILPIFQR